MFLPHIAGRMFNRPLLVLPEYAHVMATALADRLNVEPLVSQDTVDRYKRPNDRMTVDKRFGIAVLPVVGGMVHRGDGPEAESGVQSYTALQNKLTTLLDDRSVRGVLLDLDTPGGEVSGLQELAEFVVAMSGEKPIWAIANSLAASAGYWLAASVDRLYAAPGSRVGSIGVYVQHIDVSKMMEKKGVVHSFIYAGAQKLDGNPYAALADDVRARVQADVNSLWDDFAGYVAEQRGLTIEQVQGFEAALFGPEQALELGLVDGIATLGEVLNAFGQTLNRPFDNGYSLGDNSMADRLLFSDVDLAKARAEGHAAGTEEGRRAIQTEITKTHTAAFVGAIAALFPNSKKASVFAKAVTGGMAIAQAAELAAEIEEPKTAVATPDATAAAVDALLRANSPDVLGGAEQSALTSKEQRLVELGKVMHNHNAARGYRPAR